MPETTCPNELNRMHHKNYYELGLQIEKNSPTPNENLTVQ